jgi:hypothetical protein
MRLKISRHWPLAVLGLGAFACAPPKVLVNHAYASADKSIQAFIQKSGATVGSGDNQTELFNVFMRVCNQAENNSTSDCKDTLILENVNPNSL